MESPPDLSQVAHEQFSKKYPDRYIYKKISLEVWEDKKLLPSEILLFSLVEGMAQQKGFCWASNKALVSYMPPKCFDAKSSLKNRAETVSRWLKKLEKQGHLHIIRKKFGFTHWVRIYPSQNKHFIEEDNQITDQDLKNVYDTVWNQYQGWSEPVSMPAPTSLLTNINNTNINNNNSKGAAAASSDPLERDLSKSLDPPEVKRALEFIKRLPPKKKEGIRNIVGFAIDAVKNNYDSNHHASPEENKAYAKQIEKLLKISQTTLKAHVAKDYLEFVDGTWNETIKFDQPETQFKQELTDLLKKTNLLSQIENQFKEFQ